MAKNIANLLLTKGKSGNYNYKGSTLAKRTAKKVAKGAATKVLGEAINLTGAVAGAVVDAPKLISGEKSTVRNIFTSKQINTAFGIFKKKKR